MSAPGRFTYTDPCPICGGWEHMPRGRSVRCGGYRDSFGPYVHCTREERAGSLPQDPRTEPPSYLHKMGGECGCGAVHEPRDVIAPSGSRVVRRARGGSIDYVYRSRDGVPVMMVRRTETAEGKTFRQYHRNGDGWTPGLNGQQRVLYRLDELAAAPAARVVWWCEGEKDADRLADAGRLATTYPGGAGKIDQAAAAELSGRSVVLLVDNDEAGRAGAARVAAALHAAGAVVRLLELPELPQHGDVSDWLDAGRGVDELRQLAAATPLWTPPAGGSELAELHIADEPDDDAQTAPEALPPMPLDGLPAPLRELAAAAEASGSYPADFVAVFGLSALAAAAGGRWELEVEPGWRERAIVWTGVVAGPGTGKSPAFRVTFDPLVEVDREWWAEFRSALDDWQDDCAELPRGTQKPPQPRPRRVLIGDSTVEALIRLLADNPQGLVMGSDELRGVITALAQYKGGRGNDRQHFLALWTGQDVVVDRVGDEGRGRRIRAELPALSIAGGIQPGVLQSLDGEDGLPSRFLLAYPPLRRLRPSGAGVDPGLAAEWARLLRAMIEQRPGELSTLRLATGAERAMLHARLAYGERVHDSTASPMVTELASKLPGHLARLALVFAVARRALGERSAPIVLEQEIVAARQVCDYFLEHAAALPLRRPNLLATLSEQRADEGVARLVDWLRGRPDRSATQREIRRSRVAGCRTNADVDRLVHRFAETYPGSVTERRGPSGGEPSIEVSVP